MNQPRDLPHVVDFTEANAAAWDDFVTFHPDATFFHLSGWREVLRSAFGHQSYYLSAYRGDSLSGVLPLVRIKSRLFGDSLISTPFCVSGGVVAADSESAVTLERHARKLAEDLGVDYLEIRGATHGPDDSWVSKNTVYVNFSKPFTQDHDANLLQIPKKQRAVVRKAIKSGLVSEETDDVDTLYSMYSESVRNLGTPVFSKRYFQEISRVFAKQSQILTIFSGPKAIAAVMSFAFRDTILPYYGGGTEAARRERGNDFMYWELMRRSADRGLSVFDFGRSKVGTGSFRFKKHWGFEPQTLDYRYHLVKAESLPDVSPNNPKYQALISIWKRLPLVIANRVGPLVAKSLG